MIDFNYLKNCPPLPNNIRVNNVGLYWHAYTGRIGMLVKSHII